MEVIDLTLDSSPPPKDSADVDQSGKRLRKEKRKERREAKHERRERKQHEEERQRSVGRKRSSRRDENDRERDRDGKRRRESPREREADRKRSRRSPSRERDRPIPFYVDDTPAQLPPEALYTVATIVEKDPQALILPAHVSVFGETPAALPEATLDSDEGDDYIEYLDYGNRKDFIRYYEDKPEDKRTRVVCKKCGAEGEHSTALCTVLICATCGVRDEHPTRNCNIGKICFGCGMKGHISMDCPNRLSRSRTQSRPGCDRCNALSHQTAECPSWWRLYEKV
ncbi:hypothetical protein C8F04DRAFT_6698 [Mycena alexandri]|uniref:CCHC-type domain-containing protein n=1 Tax=Mycena alexandri TaxID=1745969 RepID=A0AAD6XJI5_9AGAR|nr:hypothetical protein C8F04DRAFT_6698 [Mycena alexandri]